VTGMRLNLVRWQEVLGEYTAHFPWRFSLQDILAFRAVVFCLLRAESMGLYMVAGNDRKRYTQENPLKEKFRVLG
jgi:hypothetical protein